jgi:hypothetical protein
VSGQDPVGPAPTALTTDQADLLAGVARTWTERVLSAGPTDRDMAEEGVRLSYRVAGLPPPARLVWSGSLFSGAVAAMMLSHPDAVVLSGEVWDRARGELAAGGVDPAEGRAGWPVRAHLGPWLWAAARVEMADQAGALWGEVWARTAGAVRRATGFYNRDGVGGWTDPRLALLGAEMGEQFENGPERLRLPWWATLDQVMGGPLDAAWHAAFDGLTLLVPGAIGRSRLAGTMQVAQVAGWWWPFTRVAILTPRPAAVHRDPQGRVHCPDGPAIGYPDGAGVHAWHGVRVPAAVFARLPYLRAEDIHRQRNVEVRRVLLEAFGLERYVREAGALQVGQDETGTLWRAELPGDEPLVMVEVRNATPEPDGTHRVYWLRVPPSVQTAREAVAWTFGLPSERYRPQRET